MENQEKKYITNMKKNLKKLKAKTRQKANVVIDAYFYGVNGWTYSYTYPDMETATMTHEVNDIYSEKIFNDPTTDEEWEELGAYIYIPRMTSETSQPPQYFKEVGLACEQMSSIEDGGESWTQWETLINQEGNARASLGLADHRKLHQKQNVARQGGMENLSHVRSVNQNMTKNHTRITPMTITMTDLIKKENHNV